MEHRRRGRAGSAAATGLAATTALAAIAALLGALASAEASVTPADGGGDVGSFDPDAELGDATPPFVDAALPGLDAMVEDGATPARERR